MRWFPRTLAGQVAALALAVVGVVVVAGSVLAAIDARVDGDRAARDEVTAVAVSLAQAPSTVSALTSPDPSAILQPVTDRIRRRLLRQTGGLAPDDLRLMYDHHDAVLRTVREGLIVVSDGRPALVNAEAQRLLGIGTDTPAGELPDFLTRGDGVSDELHAEGGRVLLVSCSPVSGRHGSSVVTIRDRTELAEAMGELDSMTRFAEALRSQAHESANRLHTLVALVEMGRPEEAVRLATTELELSQHLIDQMAQAVAEPALVALLLGKSAQAAERGIAFSLTEDSQVSDEATQILSSREMITVVGNLVDNALDACDPNDPWVEVGVVGDHEALEIVVADSGPGMDGELFRRATARGYSTKSGGDGAGRGLGLALVSQVVSRHHGTLTAENTYGSVVTVRIRVAQSPSGEVR